MKPNVYYPIVMTTFDATTLTNVYQVVNVAGFEKPCSLVNIVNTSGVAISLSFNGADEHDVILAHGSISYDMQTNSIDEALFKKFTKVYVKYILGAGKSGDIYITGYSTER